MVKNATWGLGAAVSRGSTHLDLDSRFVWRMVLIDQAQCFIACVKDLHAAHNGALEWVAAEWAQPCIACRFLRQGGNTVKVQVVTRQRADKVGALVLEHRVQCVRMLHMFFDKVVFVALTVDIQSSVRNHSAFVERILVRVAQGNEDIISLKLWEWKSCNPAHRLQGRLAGPLQPFCQGSQLLAAGNFIKAPNTNVDGMNLPSAE